MKKLLLALALFSCVEYAYSQDAFTGPFQGSWRKTTTDSAQVVKLLLFPNTTGQIRTRGNIVLYSPTTTPGTLYWLNQATGDTSFIRMNDDGEFEFRDELNGIVTLADLLAGGGGGGSDSITGSGTAKAITRWTGQFTVGDAVGLVQENDGSIGLTASNPKISLGNTVSGLSGYVEMSADGDLTFFDTKVGVAKTLAQLAESIPTGDQIMDSLNLEARTVTKLWSFDLVAGFTSGLTSLGTVTLGEATSTTGSLVFHHATGTAGATVQSLPRTSPGTFSLPNAPSATFVVSALSPLSVNTTTGAMSLDTTTGIGAVTQNDLTTALLSKVNLQATTPGTEQTGNSHISGTSIVGLLTADGRISAANFINGKLQIVNTGHILQAGITDSVVLILNGAQFGTGDIMQAHSYSGADSIFTIQSDGRVTSKGGALLSNPLQFNNEPNHFGIALVSLSTAEGLALPQAERWFWYNKNIKRPYFYDGTEQEQVLTLNDLNDTLQAAQIVVGAGATELLFLATADSIGGIGVFRTPTGLTVPAIDATWYFSVHEQLGSDSAGLYVSNLGELFLFDAFNDAGVSLSDIIASVGSSGHVIRDSTVVLTQRDTLKIIGNLAEVADVGGVTQVVIQGVDLDTSATSGAGTALQLNTAKTTVTSVPVVIPSEIIGFWASGGDSSAIQTSRKYPMGYSSGVVVDTIIYVMESGSSPSVVPKISYGTDISAAGTATVTAPGAVTSNTTATKVSSFDNGTIPKGNIIWLEFTTVTTKPRGFVAIVFGHRQ